MAFFREPVPEVSVWRRFRDASDTYMVLRRDALVGTRALGNAEAMVELFIELVPEFVNIFTLTVDDWRNEAVYRAEGVTQAALLDAFYALRVPLIGAGGVEFTLESPTDQLSLSAHLEVVTWSRTDHWLYLHDRAGLRERPRLRGRLWRPDRGAFPPASGLTAGLRTFVRSLALQPA
ncbi:MAG TPA: hypothetical protein VE861_11650 [Gemmatimonadaceae bacterium]|nr:hypothetical protein [Gemmatimonadaceae bacterium]